MLFCIIIIIILFFGFIVETPNYANIMSRINYLFIYYK